MHRKAHPQGYKSVAKNRVFLQSEKIRNEVIIASSKSKLKSKKEGKKSTTQKVVTVIIMITMITTISVTMCAQKPVS